MKSIAIFILFIGVILIIQGYYSNLDKVCPKQKTLIKYIPRTLYEEQLSGKDNLELFYKSMFEDVQPIRK